MTKLSFVVTSYNYEKYIEETLNSIKKQSFKDFEIIIVDDFSTDKSVKIIENFITETPDLKIKLIKHDNNQGQLKACITGMSEANGEYISFIDSDDVLLKDYAKDLIEMISKLNVGFVSCSCSKIDENGNEKISEKFDDKIEKLNILTSPFGGWFWNPMSSAMFKKSTLELVKNYSSTEDWKICPDKFLFNFVHLLNNSAILNKPLVKKRQHNLNAGNFDRTNLNIKNNLKIRQKTINFITQNKSQFIKKYGAIKTQLLLTKINLSYIYIPVQIIKFLFK